MNENSIKIIRYYKESAWDYRYLWMKKVLAMHFGFYDSKTKNHHASLDKMNRFLAETVKVKDSDIILDAGCGFGSTDIWLAKNYGCSVVGLNIVPFQVNEARELTIKEGVSDKVHFECQDYSNTSFQDKTFDIFWGLESIVHSPDKKAVVIEACRVLKPGGRILISEYLLREDPLVSQEERKYLRPALDGWVMPNLLTASEYKKILTDHGFSNIKQKDISRNVAPSLKRLKMLCLIFLPGAWILEKLGVFSKERYLNVYGSLRHADSFFKGLWHYNVITAEKI